MQALGPYPAGSREQALATVAAVAPGAAVVAGGARRLGPSQQLYQWMQLRRPDGTDAVVWFQDTSSPAPAPRAIVPAGQALADAPPPIPPLPPPSSPPPAVWAHWPLLLLGVAGFALFAYANRPDAAMRARHAARGAAEARERAAARHRRMALAGGY